MMNQRKPSRNKGQSLSEYGLAIGLVVIVGIVSLTLIGQQTSDLLGNTITKRKPTLISTAFQAGPNTAFLEAFPDITLKSPSGKTYQLPNYPATASQFKELIDSTGSDGTQRLAAFLKALSEIQDSELLSEEERDILQQLSQKGFQLAAFQNELENAASQDFQVVDRNTGKLKKLDTLDILYQVNLISAINSKTAQEGMNQDSRKEYFKNPELRALIMDAVEKIRGSGTASLKGTASVMSTMRKLKDQLTGIEGQTVSTCDSLGCRTLSSAELKERYQKEHDDFFTNPKFEFGAFVEISKKGSSTLCVHSATGKIDPLGKDCL